MQVSACCKASIVPGTRKEYPLGGSTWYQSYVIDVCEECGKECEPIEGDEEVIDT